MEDASHEDTARRYSPAQVALATLLGWPLAGAILLAVNAHRRGDRDASSMTVFIGMLSTAALMSALYILPPDVPGLASVVGFPALAAYLVARLVRRGESGQPPPPCASWGWTVATGLICGLATVGLVLAFPPEQADDVQTLQFRRGEEIRYTAGATAADARALGARLHQIGYFDGRQNKTVRLSTRDGTVVIAFVLKTGRWRNPNVIRVFRHMRADLAERIFPERPVEIHLCNDQFEAQKRLAPTP
jgi:hypothetical protein